MKNIFISYSREDEAYTSLLTKILDNNGFGYFLDKKDIRIGDSFYEVIEKNLSEASYLIILVSDNSLASQWVTYEIGFAKGKGVSVLPIIIKENLHGQLPSFLGAYLNIEIDDCMGQLTKEIEEKIIDFLISDGIVPKQLLDKSRKRLKGEVFASELLTQDITLTKNQSQEIKVRINRNDVKHAVISTPGKAHLCRKFVEDKDKVYRNREDELRELDHKIHCFLLGKSNETSLRIPLRDMQLPLRWASGGILSIVTYKNRQWVPFFFRDIKPIGWNIALGASERYFNEHWNVISDLNKELNDPWEFIYREFLEETLVLRGDPEKKTDLEFKKFYFGGRPTAEEIAQADRFAEEHTRLRQNHDMIRIIKTKDPIARFAECCIKVNLQNTRTEVTILGSGLRVPPRWNVLLCFNLLELGIEVVRVINYKLKDDDYILDGEILVNEDGSKELVRMPVALISFSYLEKTFKDENLQYTPGPQPSIIGSPIHDDDIHIFNWDVKKRLEDQGHVRHSQWQKKFAKYFVDENDCPLKSGFNTLFTPASAKTISYYFANR